MQYSGVLRRARPRVGSIPIPLTSPAICTVTFENDVGAVNVDNLYRRKPPRPESAAKLPLYSELFFTKKGIYFTLKKDLFHSPSGLDMDLELKLEMELKLELPLRLAFQQKVLLLLFRHVGSQVSSDNMTLFCTRSAYNLHAVCSLLDAVVSSGSKYQ